MKHEQEAGKKQREERIAEMKKCKDWSPRKRCFVRSYSWFDNHGV